MSQHDLNIADQTATNARADINNALQALGSNNSGATAPPTTYANMHWYDTSTNTLKQRSEADDAWISVGYFDQASNSFKVFDDTMVVDTSGTQTGIIGDQATSAWEAGTGTTPSLVSPANVKSAVDNLASSPIKAWANINGANGNIRASTGIASCVRNSTGDYTVTFTTSLMPDANYAMTGSAGLTLADNRANVDIYQLNQTTARFTVTNHGNGIRGDVTWVCVQFVR
tara:strand:+ start:1938 stop:2621 length:684 start_codon:yes stop_codon:yes gene_type:complete